MERIYEELDEVKAENEKLRVDYKIKAELCYNLKRAHSEQLAKIQEANSKVEKHAQELNEKAEEISEVKQSLEDLRRRFNEKESLCKHLAAVNDKLRVDGHEKSRELEEQNRGLALALDESNQKNIDLEQKINVFKAEIEGLKGLLSASQKKCLEAEKKVKAVREMRERDDMMTNLEEHSRKVEDQLKWKKEQFKHLEEAHQKLQDQFRASTKEWEQERSKLIDDICSLQTNLDSENRISKDLQNRLQMCNQALAHEESRRKYLEVEVSEFRTRFESTFADYQDNKSQLECMTDKRDKEIAALRHSLGTKETFYKEMEYRAGRLEEENQELLASIKELQEAQIQKAGSVSSLAKLRNKLRSVEQMHRDCSANLRAKEAEWSSQMEKMGRELNDYKFELENRDAGIEELKMELEGYHSSILQLKMQNDELYVFTLVLKAGISEAELKLANVGSEWNKHNEEREEHVLWLMKQLDMKTTALAKAERDIVEEHEKSESFLRRIDSLEFIEEQGVVMKKELDRYKEILEESSMCQSRSKEEALQIENDYKEKLREACDALDMANFELSKEQEKTTSLSMAVESLDRTEVKHLSMQKELEQALQRENDLKKHLKEVRDALNLTNLELAKERENTTSLSRAVESFDHIEEKRLATKKELEQALQREKDSKRKLKDTCDALDAANSELADKTSEGHQIEFELWIWKSIVECLKAELEQSQDLRREVESSLLAQTEVGESLKQENCRFVCELEGKDSKIGSCEEQILSLEKKLKRNEIQMEWLELESLGRELESALTVQIHAEKLFEQEKENLLQLVNEKSKKMDDLLDVVRSLEEKFNSLFTSFSSQLAEINLVSEVWERTSIALTLAMVEREEKKLMNMVLEEDISSMEKKLRMQEKALCCLKHKALDIEAELVAKQLEMEKLRHQLEGKLRNSDALVAELKAEKQNLLREREELLGFMGGLDDRICELNCEDMKLMETLGRMVAKGHGELLLDSEKENANNHHYSLSPTAKKLEAAVIEGRSPFRLLN